MAAAQIGGDLPCRPFSGLQRDIAREALRDHHVDRAETDIVSLDEADIIEIGEVGVAQHAARLADRLESLDLLDADIEEADEGLVDVEDDARHRGAHHGKVRQMLGIRADSRADVEHDALAARIGPDSRDAQADRRPPSGAGKRSPWPSAHPYCRPRPRHRPPSSSPPRWRATSRISSGRRARPGSACRPSSRRHRCDGRWRNP